MAVKLFDTDLIPLSGDFFQQQKIYENRLCKFLPCNKIKKAADGNRTRVNHLGKVVRNHYATAA